MRMAIRGVALIGDDYVRKVLRDALAAPFSAVHYSGADGRCEVLTATVGDRVYVDLESWSDAPAAARTSAIVALGVELFVIGYSSSLHNVASDLTVARRAGVNDVVAILRTGSVAPPDEDERASARAEREFPTYASWVGLASPRALRRLDDGVVGWLDALLDAGTPARPFVPADAGHVVFCAICGAAITSAVAIETWADVGARWQESRPDGDESLVPPAHAIRGDGVSSAFGFPLREGALFVHQVDLLHADDNGRGIQITCCGARPDPSHGANLDCPAGHPVGELWTDCCAPQGGHLDLSLVVVR